MSFGQQKPVVAGMFQQSPPSLHQSLLQARQRPILDPLRECQLTPQIPQVISQQAQCQPDLVRAEPMAGEPRHFHCLPAFFDPLLRRPALVVEPYHSPAGRLQVGHDESDSGEQLPEAGTRRSDSAFPIQQGSDEDQSRRQPLSDSSPQQSWRATS
jgi:hypothetical protein